MKNNNAVQHNNQTASEQTLSPDEGHVLHKVRDPVCGMAILPDRAHSSIRYQDHQLYFCSASWALLQIVGGDKLIIPFC